MIAGVEIDKGHVILTAPFYEWFIIQKLEFAKIYLYAKFGDSSFSCSRDIIGGPQNLKWITGPWPRHFKGDLPFYCWDLT